VAACIDRGQIRDLADALIRANRIVTGEGRPGFMAKAFAMRLMHLGLPVSVIGETTTPAVRGTDTVIAVSGSGTTGGTVRVAEQTAGIGATIWAVTTDPTSPLGIAANGQLVVPAAPRYRRADEAPTIQPLSSLFDQTTHIALDVACLRIAGAPRRRQCPRRKGALRLHSGSSHMEAETSPHQIAVPASELLGQSDDVTLRIGDQGKRDSRYGDRLLHDAASQPQRVGDRVLHVLDSDEKGDEITIALQRTDCRIQRARNAGLDKRVTRNGPLGRVGPAEQGAEEPSSSVRVRRPDLRVNDGMTHDYLHKTGPP
jgi:6-phospho-3-hexuloisomerase